MQPKHDVDFYAWALDCAARLSGGQLSEVDIESVAEELEAMGKAQKHALWGLSQGPCDAPPQVALSARSSRVSWRISIGDARDEIIELLEDSPSLANKIPEILERRYSAARNRAALETGLPSGTFSGTCPFSVDQLLNPDYWPD